MSQLKSALVVACCMSGIGQFAVAAETPESISSSERAEINLLRSQLAARQSINEHLLRRIEALEKRLAADSVSTGAPAASLDPSLPKPRPLAVQPESLTAIEDTLVARGVVVLSPGGLRLTPVLSWSHSGSGTASANIVGSSVTLESGLPGGMTAAVSLPYLHKHDPSGSNAGVGDISLSLAKRLTTEGAALPSLVARATYVFSNGKDPFELPAIGGGARAVAVSLSAVKRYDPVAIYGSVSYAHALNTTGVFRVKRTGVTVFDGRVVPGDSVGAAFGISLAATPEVAVDAGVSVAFARRTVFKPTGANEFDAPGAATAYLNLGTSILVARDLVLSVGAAAGLRKDASDFVFTVALPYRF